MLTGLLYAMKGEIESLLPEGAEPEKTVAGVPFYRIRENRGRLLRRRGEGKRCHGHPAVYRPVRARDGSSTWALPGCFENVPIGTLVLADRFMQHDVDTSGIGDPVGLVSTVNRIDFPTADLKKAKTAMDRAGYAYRVGSVATGEWFATECDRARWIAETFHPLLIEMEGGSGGTGVLPQRGAVHGAEVRIRLRAGAP